MKKQYNFVLFLIPLFILLLSCNLFAAADVSNSFDTDIRIFGNWKVYILNLKDNKKFVVMDGIRNQIMMFRITLDNNGHISYTEIQPNTRGYPHKLEQKGNVLLTIGDRQYNIPATIMAHHNFVITFLNNMPKDFIQLAKNNKYFMLSYNTNVSLSDPISLEGFNDALKYAEQLKPKVSSLKR